MFLASVLAFISVSEGMDVKKWVEKVT